MKIYRVLLCLCIGTIAFSQEAWVETKQEHFADGTYERTLYVSQTDSGTIEYVPRYDLNNDGYVDLWTADANGPYARVYWGSAAGYTPSNRTLYPTTGAANCDAADLDRDGYADFIVAHRNTPKVSIYWGTPSGPNPGFYLDIPTTHEESQAVFIADLNKDGYLDLITSLEVVSNYAAILWGSQTGYSTSNRMDLPISFGIHNIEVADLNNDNWLDILFVQYVNPDNVIYWGSDTGFSPANYTLLPGPDTHGASVADLDGNGYLDIIFNAWNGSSSYIYWGNSTGYFQQVLIPGSCFGGSSVQDMNDDGYLDILYYRTYSPQYLYWGSETGYSDDDTMIINYNYCASGGVVYDFNNDGALDIFYNSMSSASHLLWGPAYTSSISLPVSSDHHAMFREIGNVYNRQYYDDYESSVYDAGDTVYWWKVTWDGACPGGSDLIFSIRTGNTPTPDSTWSDWALTDTSTLIHDSLRSQYIQYRTRFKYTDIAYLPSLYEVSISYDQMSGTGIHTTTSLKSNLNINPNPFSVTTTIEYTISQPHNTVTIDIIDNLGRHVRTLVDQELTAGNHSWSWDGYDNEGHLLPCGIYFVIIEREGEVWEHRPIVFIK